MPLAGLPPQRLAVDVTAFARHLPDHRRGAADLTRDIDEPPPPGVKTQCELLLLTTEMPMPALHPMPPEISVLLISQHPLR